ncbi:hypothetical protein [Hymenobacter rubripertinctus]|nr:hypothetical protein [Hymenobacter rubripertinctus]
MKTLNLTPKFKFTKTVVTRFSKAHSAGRNVPGFTTSIVTSGTVSHLTF